MIGADGKVTPVQESNGTMKLDIASTPVVVLMESENRSGLLFFLAVFGANEAAQMTVKTDSDWVFNRGEMSITWKMPWRLAPCS